MTDRVDELNEDALRSVLLDSCGSPEWCDRVIAARPYGSAAGFEAALDTAWAVLSEAGWLAAFATHTAPVPAGPDPGTSRAAELALELYSQQFGVPFVCSVESRAADELLMRVRIRLANDPATERQVARDEQRRAVDQRLRRALEQLA